MTLHRLLLVLALAGTLMVGCDFSTNKATGAREVEPVALTLANPYPGDGEIGEWVQAVERLSRGAVRIDVRGGWRSGQLEADRGMLRDVRAGRVDIAHTPVRAWDTLGVNSFQALEAPLLVDSLVLQERVLGGELGAAMLSGVRAAGVEPVGIFPGPLRRPIGIGRDLLGPRDYSGARIGLRPSRVHEATMQALGARVVRTPDRGLPPGLDGSEADLAQLDVEPFRGRARSVTADVVLWSRATTLVINRDAWRELTSGQRAVLTDAARAAVGPVMARERNYERGGLKLLCERDFPLVRAGAGELAALRRAVAPVYRQLARDPAVLRTLKRIQGLKRGLKARPVPACSPERGRPPASRSAPLVGTWQVSVTRDKLGAARREQGEGVEDNWGDYTLVLGAEGGFELLNDRHPGEPVGTGTWSVRADVLALRAGGSIEAGAGETWRYRWTLFRGALVLRKLSVGPTALTVAPLRRP